MDADRTFSLEIPEPLAEKLRAYAAKRDQSPSEVVSEWIREKAHTDDVGREERKRRALERMRNATGHGGLITWTREELYERR